jgi:tetratricopeptide (TPR) repeat protein
MNGRKFHRLRLVTIECAFGLMLVTGPTLRAQSASGASETASSVVGVVCEQGGSPVAGAWVHLLNKDGDKSPQATTDSSGKFVIRVQDAGTYQLSIQKPGFSDFSKIVTLPSSGIGPPLKIVLARSDGKRSSGQSQPEMQLSDNTDFTVAGITDWTAAGGHGSDINLRTSEALAEETRRLEPGASISANSGAGGPDLEELTRRRDRIKSALAKNDHADLYRQLAEVDEQLNDPLAAEHEYERATQLDPTEANYFAWAAELLLHRAIQPAVEVFTRGTHAFPHSERMLAGLGAALYASGLYPQAAERLCAASDLQPADLTPYHFLGKMVEAYAQPLPCSLEKLARFSNKRPENAAAHYYYAVAVWKATSAPEKAAAASKVELLLKKSIAADPKFAKAYLQLGIVYSALPEIAKAVSAYQKAISINPSLAEAHFRLGQIYKKTGEPSNAAQEFRTYEQIQKTDAANVEKQRREIQQFVVVFKDQPQVSKP